MEILLRLCSALAICRAVAKNGNQDNQYRIVRGFQHILIQGLIYAGLGIDGFSIIPTETKTAIDRHCVLFMVMPRPRRYKPVDSHIQGRIDEILDIFETCGVVVHFLCCPKGKKFV
jgi:hypothetical protein